MLPIAVSPVTPQPVSDSSSPIRSGASAGAREGAPCGQRDLPDTGQPVGDKLQQGDIIDLKPWIIAGMADHRPDPPCGAALRRLRVPVPHPTVVNERAHSRGCLMQWAAVSTHRGADQHPAAFVPAFIVLQA